TTQEWRNMPGVGEHALARANIERQIDAGHEDVVLPALEERSIDALEHRGGIARSRRRDSKIACDAGHEERSRDTLAGDVADEDAEPMLRQPEDVVEVAAHPVGRAIFRDELDAFDLRKHPREKAHLDLLREQEILREPLLLEGFHVH